MAAGVIKQSRRKEEKQACVQCSCIISAQKEWDNKQLQDPEEITKKLQDLQLDRTELNNLLKASNRRSVRDVICLEIDINLARINSLRELQKNGDRGQKWSMVCKRNKGRPFLKSQPLSPIPITKNRYDLSGVMMDKAVETSAEQKNEYVSKGINTFKRENTNKHRIIILGDSHTRGMASNLQNQLRHNCVVQGIVKPGAMLKKIADMPTAETRNLTRQDVCVIWGGIHDVGKNETQMGLSALR
jgi:hypothetical protein